MRWAREDLKRELKAQYHSIMVTLSWLGVEDLKRELKVTSMPDVVQILWDYGRSQKRIEGNGARIQVHTMDGDGRSQKRIEGWVLG